MADAKARPKGEKSPFAVFMQALISPLVTVGIALVVTLLTLIWDRTPPARFIENFTYDLRMAAVAPAPRDDIVIVKMDDPSMAVMQAQSECHCFSPVDKVWLADVIVDLSNKGAKAILLDILFSSWRTPEEHAAFVERIKDVKTPIVAAVDPAVQPGQDGFLLVPGFHYASPNALMKYEDDVVREYDPRPDESAVYPQGLNALAAEVFRLTDSAPPTEPFVMRFRAPVQTTGVDRGAIALSYPAAQIRDIPAQFIAGKTVMIGRLTRFEEGASGILEDMHPTALRFSTGHYDGTPGVEVHAHALAQMRDGDEVFIPPLLWQAISVLVAALAGAWLGRSTFRWWVATIIVIGVLVAVVVGGVMALSMFSMMVNILAPLTAFGLTFFIQSRLAQTQLQDERKLYATTLERYLAPQVIKRIEDGSQPVEIGAQMREITALVTDLEDSSTLVATTPPEEFALIINGYFDGLYEVLWKHEAMLDKLTGDGVIVLFGAPVEHEDHADRAVACARDISAYSAEYSKEVMARFGIKFGRTRSGVHSGPALVGNFGGEKRFNYTAYGQVVVIAARLEAANKEYDTTVLFSDTTLARCKSAGDVKALGQISLKGVPQPITVYTTV